jgi:hypothetical protein
MIQGHVLMVESDDVDATREGHKFLEVGEITNMAGSELCGAALRFGKHPEFEAQVNRCRNHHPR